jgi:hypothetical protein
MAESPYAARSRAFTHLLCALAVPLVVMGLVLLPVVLSIRWGAEMRAPFYGLTLLVSVGLPQYLVFAPVLGTMTWRAKPPSRARLMILAPVLFLPFFLAPWIVDAVGSSLVSSPAFGLGLPEGAFVFALMSAIVIGGGYLCVGIAYVVGIMLGNPLMVLPLDGPCAEAEA